MSLVWFVVVFAAAYIVWRTIHSDRRDKGGK